MAWILHISDVHLGKVTKDQYLDDTKTRVLSPGNRLTTQGVLRDTLNALGHWEKVDKFDAVVFSGDVTHFAREDGYEAFDALLGQLGSRRPDNDAVVVVPGNHDVKWQTPPGSVERYELFTRFMRKRGYVSPLLDDIDLDERGGLRATAVNPILQHPEFVVLAMNSSNWCGVVEPFPDDGVNWDRALRLAGPRTRSRAREDLEKIRTHDLPRISAEQLHGIQAALEKEGLAHSTDGRVRIAVLHHHLLPVSTREEVKTFESVTNLAEVRLFLRDRGFEVVLHGHKHAPSVFWDHIQGPDDDLSKPTSRMLVASSPGQFRHGELTCRVLEVLPRAPHERGARADLPVAPMVRIHAITGRRRGEDVGSTTTELASLWRGRMEESRLPFEYVYGRTINDVYERLQSLFYERGQSPLHDLICVIEAPGNATVLPTGFPPTGEADERAWLLSLVKWWQQKESRIIGQDKRFRYNHGERIYGWGQDSIALAADALMHDGNTTRSIVVLIDPRTEAGREDVDYPAFVLVQLRLARGRLDVVGYFRKQDARHWWAMNVAELLKLQLEAIKELADRGVPTAQGRIVTFASTALIDEVVPALAVTAIDRAVDDDPKLLWRLAYSATHPDLVPDRAAELAHWESVFADLESEDGRVATVGAQELMKHLEFLYELRPEATFDVFDPLRTFVGSERVLADASADAEARLEHAVIARVALTKLLTEVRKRLSS